MSNLNIIYFPSNKNYNPYNTRMQEIVEKAGVTPVGINSLLKPKTTLNVLTGTKNIFIFNWFEDYPFNSKGKLNPIKLFIYIFIIVYAKIFGRIIYIKHNLTKHNLDSKHKKSHALCQYLIEKIAAKTYVHSNTVAQENGYEYLPHPLYKTFNIRSETSEKKFLCFGMISRYKGYIELLENWPQEYPLTIAGACTDLKLLTELTEIADRRKMNLTIKNYSLSDRELELEIMNSIAIVLPHTSDSCIVSGAAYLAFSLGSLVLVRDSTLYKNIAEPTLTGLLNTESIRKLYVSAEETNSAKNKQQRLDYVRKKYSDTFIFEKIKQDLVL
ncbi:hypothetical protein AQS70_17715 [Pseudomonas endophytica]|uniref:Glycosyl transferase family 1 domain-containing protein n=1 Tax=Pseudomonas endophytica TaxID=1563157 RepID=A0A0N8VRV2_9PSED|nr:glycosyltransferase [Pseudomonas endophytica]KQB51556.1 hypothetical protein AQS70_17715 [Pseudomonas endophytica]